MKFQDVAAHGTPRRLVLIVRGLESVQRKPAEEIRGPSKQAAYDAQGKPTPALGGFLRARGGSLQQAKVVPSPKGDYVYLVLPPRSVPTERVLPDVLTQLIGRLHAPKTMRWNAGHVRFARPIRWVVARYGTRPISCTLGECSSGDTTWVGLPLRPRGARVASAQQYLQVLARDGVILNPEQRRQRIKQLVERLATPQRAVPAPEMLSHGLLDEVTFLVERPVALLGAFNEKYLALPREVLLASMAKYQRVFALEAKGAIRPRFVAILDGAPGKPAQVRAVMERILNARLADSLLFWSEDHRRLPLEQMAGALSGVTVHEQLGSMADKSRRLRALCEPLAEAWQLTHEERQHLRRACQLAKADLVSALVREFPTLQGVIGKYYAQDSGEPRAVAEAIEEQYLPAPRGTSEGAGQTGLPAPIRKGQVGLPAPNSERQAGGRLPRTLIGRALAILEKFDTLLGYFGLGIEPTGDQDPFGLRRAAQGIVEVAWAAHRPLPLDRLLRAGASLEPFRDAEPKKHAVASARVQRYLLERLFTFAWPSPAPSADYIHAVLGSPCHDLIDTMDRIRGLQELDGQADLLKAAKVIERTRNILRGAALQQTEVDPSKLQEPPEHRLWQLYRSNEEQVVRLSEGRSYAEATRLFGKVFYEPLHEFFDRVMVNVPDASLQQNRLALMRAINTLYTERIADLSKLTVLQLPREDSP